MGAVGTVGDTLKRRFSEFRVSSTEDCQLNVRMLPATVLTKGGRTYFQILKATAKFDYRVATANCELIFVDLGGDCHSQQCSLIAFLALARPFTF